MRIVTSGGDIIPLMGDFRPEIKEIARSLARIRRFTGHSPLSVAQHSVLVSRLVPQRGIYPLAGLLHDAQEAYVGDVSTPVKECIENICHRLMIEGSVWDMLELPMAARIRKFYGLPADLPPCVHAADQRAARIEVARTFDLKARRAFRQLGVIPDDTENLSFEDLDAPFKVWDEYESRIKFLARFKVLTEGMR